MPRKKPATRSTHEDLLRFILGDEYEALNPDGGPREVLVMRHVRRRGTVLRAVLILLAVGFASLALIFGLFPRSMFLVGILDTPVPLAASTDGFGTPSYAQSGSITVQTEEKTRVEWYAGDYRHALDYTFINGGDSYAYPTLVVDLRAADGRVLDSLPFGIGSGVVPPDGEGEGTIYWGRDTAGGMAASFSVRLRIGKESTTDPLAPAVPSEPATDTSGSPVDPDPAGGQPADGARSPQVP